VVVLECLEGTGHHCDPWQDAGNGTDVRAVCYGREKAAVDLVTCLRRPGCRGEMEALGWRPETGRVESNYSVQVLIGGSG